MLWGLPPDISIMPSATAVVSNQSTTNAQNNGGIAALLRAMGLSAVQVTPDVVALVTPAPARG